MDVPSPVDRAMPTTLATPGISPAVPDVEARPQPPRDEDIAARLAEVERQMAEIGARLNQLAADVPDTLRVVVAEQVDEVSADLRHSVSDLGRLLLRDLGRLTQVLAEHREQIVADLQKAGLNLGAPAPAASEEPAGSVPNDRPGSVPGRSGATAGDTEASSPASPDEIDPDESAETAKRRRGTHLLKRREG